MSTSTAVERATRKVVEQIERDEAQLRERRAERDRLVATLRLAHGWSVTEIADLTGMSRSNVHTVLRIAAAASTLASSST